MRRPRLYDRVRYGFLVFTLVWLGWYAQGAAVGGQRADLHQRAADRLQLGLLPDGPADLHPVVRGRGGAAVLGPRRVLRLAVPVRRAAGADQPRRPAGSASRRSRCRGACTSACGRSSTSSSWACSGSRSTRWPTAERLSEVEPFKTAIILRFVRTGRSSPTPSACWRRTCSSSASSAATCARSAPRSRSRRACGCSTGCKRYRECGIPCQRCANECPVQAIHPDGAHQRPTSASTACNCQMLYHHDQKCPVMIQAAEARETPGAVRRAMLPSRRAAQSARTRRPRDAPA